MVQRRRANITKYVDTETPFPKREEREEPYQLSKPIEDLTFDDLVVSYFHLTSTNPSSRRSRHPLSSRLMRAAQYCTEIGNRKVLHSRRR